MPTTPAANNTATEAVEESSDSEGPQSQVLDEFTMLTYLLRLTVILRHGNGDASMHSFAEDAALRPDLPWLGAGLSPELAPLDAVSAILVQDHEVVAACHQSKDAVSFTLLEDHVPQGVEHQGGGENNEPEDDFSYPIDLPKQKSEMPLKVTALANPNSPPKSTKTSNSSPDSETPNERSTTSKESSGQGANTNLHNLRIVPEGHDYWPEIKKNPLYCINK